MAADLFFRSITELNQMLVKREISARELATQFCNRLEQLGPQLNALAVSTRKAALDNAKNVDDELKRKRLRGPLQGIPFGAKDLLAYPGYPTTWGAKPFANQTFDYKAAAIERLEARGALLIGKLAMVELAGGGGYDRPSASHFGPGLNPWSLGHWAGGSSSGSGAAVAAGLVPFAIGSETWGSILGPSAFCAVTGLRPTYGYVSRYGAMALSWTMDKIGPMCHSALDCALVLQVMSGGDERDFGSAGKNFYYGPEFVQQISKMKVGYNPVDFEEWTTEDMRPAYREALDVLRRLGVELKEIEFPKMPYSTVAGSIIDAESASIFEPFVKSGQVDELADVGQIAGLKAAQEIKSNDYLRAMRIRAKIQEELTPTWRDLDIIVAPSTTRTANPIDQPLRGSAANRGPRPEKRGLTDLGAISNLLGWPSLSVPCGFAGTLPVGLQFVTRPFNENRILAAGVAYQRETDWHTRRPPFGA